MKKTHHFSLAVDRLWYRKHPLRWLLWPFAQFYKLVISIRRVYLLRFRQQQFPVPIIVVGNLTVGGVGKTPLVIALAKKMQARGLRVGIVSRGYGASIKRFPYEVHPNDDAWLTGDEPLLIAKKTNCPVVISPRRTEAVQYLLANHQSEVIISDDGLQHYAMGRAIEIVVIDGIRGLGNKLCLPAGPLREPSKRLQKADFIVINEGEEDQNYRMTLEAGCLTNILTGQEVKKEAITTPVAAVAAIGHPQRFFATLHNLGISFKKYPFPDHHRFQPHELQFREKIVVMTEKDAVKCQAFAMNSWYFLPVEATLDDTFWQALWSHKQLQGAV
ncbi:tetraacyldisaccharide 4'-kinase [Legionella jamestowniensis]|uniref:Tetraacyldisaccharide 4'-kinase n=1 Tax=Legionella jamestowniensis TaxID=455 RepID=A0A0W0ULB8_9GAMM|nr:tetraacyldisaccharide 4'-kinase [Legionella jamestowniensis]KTD08660.1 tetraacyldisaccharide 4'-kinase [Legionella jamestowniensis]OCH96895.1 tetraacyldisaccharide 4'-kinase [Legionella jamestowniensis]SFL54471.1 lipid-A-disaccharide kinase [Legionella jamestowniensis DSM 19215]